MAKKPRRAEPADEVRYWLDEISSARKREKDWRKDGQRIIEIYDGTKASTTPFNILFSNVETMVPALYSAIPRPVVTRRYKDADPLGLAAAKAGQRVLEFLVDTNLDGYESFNDAMKAGTLDAVLPGRGVTSVKYDFQEGQLDAETPYKEAELVCPETRVWNRVFFGYAKRWSKVPWVAYEEHLDRDECLRLFGDKANEMVFTEGEGDGDDPGEKAQSAEDRETGSRKTAVVYQIWDKDGGKKVRYIAETYRDGYLRVDDDPLELSGFFNCPRPLQFVDKVSDLTPVALYTLYESQAKELNRLTIRITRVTEALKARGAYDSGMGEDLKKIMDGDDNELIPAQHSSSIAYEKGLQNAIWFMPLAELITVLEKLLLAREQCKQTIYEIIGIADIMRGASKASETLGAQEIKNQWGTLRIKPKQAEVQRYARDLLRMMLEIAATKFSEETWAQMTGLPYTTAAQRQQLDAVAQAAQMSGQPLDPQTQAGLAAPTWEAVLGMLRKDTQRAYRIDIETNSTIEPEAAEDQKHMAELMNALGQFINGVGPLVEKGVLPFEAAQTMMLAISRRFRFGSEIEEQLKAMKPPAPQDDGQAQQLQEQLAQAQQQAQSAQQEAQATKLKAELDKRDADLKLREAVLAAEREVFKLEQQAAQEKIALRDQVGKDKLQNEQNVISLRDQAAKREQQMADRSQSKLGEGLSNIKKTAEAVLTSEAKILAEVQQQGQETREVLSAVLQAIRAPRTRTPVRGKDGRIEKVIDKVDDEKPTLQ